MAFKQRGSLTWLLARLGGGLGGGTGGGLGGGLHSQNRTGSEVKTAWLQAELVSCA